jgi:hypothetical protein
MNYYMRRPKVLVIGLVEAQLAPLRVVGGCVGNEEIQSFDLVRLLRGGEVDVRAGPRRR